MAASEEEPRWKWAKMMEEEDGGGGETTAGV